MSPFFSIITATRNAASVLPGLLSSLEEQTCRDFELIIQDAASTDSTLDCLKNYQNRLPAVSVASAPDSGIYDAWNRAILQAHGEWLLFLGADDRLAATDVLNQMKKNLSEVPQITQMAAGQLHLIDTDGSFIRTCAAISVGGKNCLASVDMPVPYPALFVRRELCLKNPFDTTFRIAGDFDFLCRVWDDTLIQTFPLIVVCMQHGGLSFDPYAYWLMRYETVRSATKHLGFKPIRMGIMLIKAGIVTLTFRCIGSVQAAKLFNSLRQLRGLSPSWRVPTLKAHSQDKS